MVTEGGRRAGWLRDHTGEQQGDFVWHKHDGEDERFLVIAESMTVDFRDRAVSLEPDECLVVPKGVKHKLHAEIEC